MLPIASTPLNQQVDAMAFVNTSTRPGVLKGSLTIQHDRRRRDLRTVELHWGRSAQDKLAVNSKIVAYGSLNTGSEEQPSYVYQRPLLYIFKEDTPIPSGASHLQVWVTDVKETQHLYASRPLKSEGHLLPPSASALERHLSLTGSRLNQLPVLVDTLWDPSRCPSRLLPWLAWATSSDIWFSNPDDRVEESIRRRELIRKSAFIHQHKGTKASVQSVLKAFADVSITLTEWWQQTPNGLPHTFRLDMLVNGNTPGAGTAELNNKLRQAINSVKPVRSHYSFSLSLVQTSHMRLAASSKAVSYKRFNMAAVLGG